MEQRAEHRVRGGERREPAQLGERLAAPEQAAASAALVPLARGVAEGRGIAPAEVQSPTFTLIREHRGSGEHGGRLVHVDLYRLAPGEAAALGLEELLAGPGVKVVEWAERLPFPVPVPIP